MRDPFLCPDCQKLGYCRKYNTKPQKRNFDKEEEAFFQRVNKPKVIFKQEHIATPVKLISLDKIRAQFKNQSSIMDANHVQISPHNTNTEIQINIFSIRNFKRPKQSKNVTQTTKMIHA
jgi:hypothetical protein